MVPNFALLLSFDGIVLLRRRPQGWARIAEVALDAADIDGAMAGMRDRARALDPGGDSVLLVLPNEQVRYLDIVDPGGRRADAARAALDGATPYPVADLTFDCSARDGRLLVAAVARETLEEAESFARRHGFRPVAHAAMAPADAFNGAVYFGPARSWTGRKPTRPDAAIAVVTPDDAALEPVEKPAPKKPAPGAPAAGKPAAAPKSGSAGAPASAPSADTAPAKTARPDGGAPADVGAAKTSPATPPADATAGKEGADTDAAAPDGPAPTFATRRTAPEAPDVSPAPALPPAGQRRFALAPANAARDTSPAQASDDDLPPPLSPAVQRLRATVKGAAAPVPRPDDPDAPSEDRSGADRKTALAGRAAAIAVPGAGAAAPADAARLAQEEERRRMTVFGARDRQGVGGKPRFLGLALTLALLGGLALVGLWAGAVRGPAPPEDAEPTVAAVPAPEPAPPAPDTRLATPQEAEPDPVAPPPAPAETADLPEAIPEIAPPPADDARPLTPEEAAATYAATGIWQRAPEAPAEPPTGGTDDIYVASIDPAVTQFDAVALPRAPDGARQAPPEDPGLPPPPDMTFDFDERGLIRATPDGALSPDGLRIFEGAPPVVPPLRSEALPGPVTEAPPLAEFRGIRPEARPDDLIELNERAILQGLSVDELAAFRPAARPRSAQDDAGLLAPDATAQAVADSLAPAMRPQGFAEIVAAARAAREAAPPQPETAPVQTASLAAVPRTVSPQIPSTAEVARAATIENAVNLRDTSLFGIYGSEGNRRALVRLRNGRYEKVQVGDRLDGGQVVAITDSQLVYRRGGRTVTLDMPRG